MSYSSATSTATPAWTDCFATDDGRIVVVGGSFQLLVYNIKSATWGDTATPASSLKYGPSVSSGMFLSPVYLQSRILADGFTALVVCTLKWNSQPQPYYLDTNTWTVKLAIGTAETTPPGTLGSSSGWGPIPGGSTLLLPPAGFRHYTLAILGQDKNQPKDHYGNGRAFILGGYSTLVTGQVQDWDAMTSFPVQQAPSNVVVRFGDAGMLPNPTRGPVAYPISSTSLVIFPGNGGGTSTNQQRVQVYDANSNKVTQLSDTTGGLRNTIFRGATVIGQGQQIIVHGGLTTLEFGASQDIPPLEFLTQTIGVWDGGSQQWGDTLRTYVVPSKSKALMIGLIAGGVVLLVLISLGVWQFRRKKRLRLLEEEEREAKGMVLKNEDTLQKEHKVVNNNSNNNNNNDDSTGTVYYNPAGYPAVGTAIYQQLPPSSHAFAENYSTGRNSSVDIARHQNQSPYHQTFAQAELIDDNSRVQSLGMKRTVQEYPSSTSIENSQGYISPSSTQYLAGVSASSQPLFGGPSHGIVKEEYSENNENSRDSKGPERLSPEIQSARPYSSSSTLSTNPLLTARSSHMSSPTFSTTYSVPDSLHWNDVTQQSFVRSAPSANDFTNQGLNSITATPKETDQSTAQSPHPPVPMQSRPRF
ncbi:hypothetical protein BGZ51_008067 [Haplosporangium sp. Z 767]|nr:hypothetical protein BGZ51_008067 [Haplosporangium sp. Z 767]